MLDGLSLSLCSSCTLFRVQLTYGAAVGEGRLSGSTDLAHMAECSQVTFNRCCQQTPLAHAQLSVSIERCPVPTQQLTPYCMFQALWATGCTAQRPALMQEQAAVNILHNLIGKPGKYQLW